MSIWSGWRSEEAVPVFISRLYDDFSQHWKPSRIVIYSAMEENPLRLSPLPD